MDLRQYKDEALRLGAENSVVFNIEDIVFDPRTILKCMFGCESWGSGHTCPSRPGNLKVWDYAEILKRYSWGLIIHSHDKKICQDISFEIERKAFINGYYFAFSMSDCAICNECAGFRGQPCVNQKKARPAFHSVGIDVYKTVHKFGLPIETLKDEDEQQNWYSAVFVT